MHSKNIIIGSGPAGVSAASEILKNNKDLLILDVGSETSRPHSLSNR